MGDEISRSELNDIATDPDNRHVLTVKEFNKLSAIRAAFQVTICTFLACLSPQVGTPESKNHGLIQDFKFLHRSATEFVRESLGKVNFSFQSWS